mmetsp:Transcript_27578/g.49694  ORF Transcript_27578/g.49694 Transcript_27578/m.49694 type:complete len:335 (-) Transcript_27578:443-1447(-)
MPREPSARQNPPTAQHPTTQSAAKALTADARGSHGNRQTAPGLSNTMDTRRRWKSRGLRIVATSSLSQPTAVSAAKASGSPNGSRASSTLRSDGQWRMVFARACAPYRQRKVYLTTNRRKVCERWTPSIRTWRGRDPRTVACRSTKDGVRAMASATTWAESVPIEVCVTSNDSNRCDAAIALVKVRKQWTLSFASGSARFRNEPAPRMASASIRTALDPGAMPASLSAQNEPDFAMAVIKGCKSSDRSSRVCDRSSSVRAGFCKTALARALRLTADIAPELAEMSSNVTDVPATSSSKSAKPLAVSRLPARPSCRSVLTSCKTGPSSFSSSSRR